ncbi:MAG: quinolinate synthase NadA [bacterium]|nr:quinolinate synthase NadA [bacterium]
MKIQDKILELKKKKNAIILVHNYQIGEVQDIADLLGDSLDLSRKAQSTTADIILFCGVHFMAEIAKILSPEKMVLLPDVNAGCPLADMAQEDQLKKLKDSHPDAIVVAYVNTSAKIKALADVCCTSANAIKVISQIEREREIIFVPDQWLGAYAAKKLNRELILWPGFCPTHMKIIPEVIIEKKKKHPEACVILHPECREDSLELADEIFGTGGMLKCVKESSKEKFIIGTETGIIYRLKKENPEKEFYPAQELAICPNMKLTTLEKVLWALEEEAYEIKVDEETAQKARSAIEKMLAIR